MTIIFFTNNTTPKKAKLLILIAGFLCEDNFTFETGNEMILSL